MSWGGSWGGGLGKLTELANQAKVRSCPGACGRRSAFTALRPRKSRPKRTLPSTRPSASSKMQAHLKRMVTIFPRMYSLLWSGSDLSGQVRRLREPCRTPSCLSQQGVRTSRWYRVDFVCFTISLWRAAEVPPRRLHVRRIRLVSPSSPALSRARAHARGLEEMVQICMLLKIWRAFSKNNAFCKICFLQTTLTFLRSSSSTSPIQSVRPLSARRVSLSRLLHTAKCLSYSFVRRITPCRNAGGQRAGGGRSGSEAHQSCAGSQGDC